MNFLNFVKQMINPDLLKTTISLVEYAALKFLNNEERRQWVVKELMNTLKIRESVARLAVEIAVAMVKDKK